MRALFLPLLFALFVVSCNDKSETSDIGAESASHEREPFVEVEVDAMAAEALRRDDPSIVVIDVRTPAEFAEGHIPDAVNIDFQASDFEERVSELDREKSYLVHCEVGGRSGNSMRIFEDLGFRDIFHLRSGFRGWKDARMPVEQ